MYFGETDRMYLKKEVDLIAIDLLLIEFPHIKCTESYILTSEYEDLKLKNGPGRN